MVNVRLFTEHIKVFNWLLVFDVHTNRLDG